MIGNILMHILVVAYMLAAISKDLVHCVTGRFRQACKRAANFLQARVNLKKASNRKSWTDHGKPRGISKKYFGRALPRVLVVDYKTKSVSPHALELFKMTMHLDHFLDTVLISDKSRTLAMLKHFKPDELVELLTKNGQLKSQILHAIKKSSGHFDAKDLSVFPLHSLGTYLQQMNGINMGTEKSGCIRRICIECGLLHVLLETLAFFAEQKHRCEPLSLEPPDTKTTSIVAVGAPPTSSKVSKMSSSWTRLLRQWMPSWTKSNGVGYGWGLALFSQWNMASYQTTKQWDMLNVAAIFNVLRAFIQPLEDEAQIADELRQLESHFVVLLYRSCLAETLNSFLAVDSFVEIIGNAEVYESALGLLVALANTKPVPMDQSSLVAAQLSARSEATADSVDVFHLLFLGVNMLQHGCTENDIGEGDEQKKEEQQLLRMVTNLHRINKQITDYLRMVGNQSKVGIKAINEKALLEKLSGMSKTACAIINNKYACYMQSSVAIQSTSNNVESSTGRKETQYCDAMRPLQFASIPFMEQNNWWKVPYHYRYSLPTASGFGKHIRKIAQELVGFHNSSLLPLSGSSSCFVRSCEERIDVLKFLITGPSGTPYQNGCFEFDVLFPTNYPQSPMQVNLQTTGNFSVRFNPNLYNNGMVCLSILNTWTGRPEEMWNPSTSSLAQVIISLQSLVLIADPYFNEPILSVLANTPVGKKHSQYYNVVIKAATVRWAMLEQLRNPPVAFSAVIREHFKQKRDEIKLQVEQWVREVDEVVRVKPWIFPNFGGFTFEKLIADAQAMKTSFASLKVELDKS